MKPFTRTSRSGLGVPLVLPGLPGVPAVLAALAALALLALFSLAALPTAAGGAERDLRLPESYGLRSSVLGAAGAPGSSEGVRLNGTLGQPQAIGRCGSASVQHIAGFWATVLGGGASAVLPIPIAWPNALHRISPSPFAAGSGIEFSCARAGCVSLALYDVRGARVRTLLEREMDPGFYRVVWDGTDERGARVATGLYFCRLTIGDFHTVRRMVLVK